MKFVVSFVRFNTLLKLQGQYCNILLLLLLLLLHDYSIMISSCYRYCYGLICRGTAADGRCLMLLLFYIAMGFAMV